MHPKKLWIYPLIFGMLGAFIGLVLRYAFAGNISNFPFKNLLHAHSHSMLLGLILNALIILIWTSFTKGIDKISYRYYIVLQVCLAFMTVAFILQGYAFYSIVFSTVHLWTSYILLIRLWKRLEGNKQLLKLIKIGVVFHFVSSLGPYALGPLMVLDLKESPWYQQAIFFYLHFQFFGIFFTWLLALLIQKTKLVLTKKHLLGIVFGLIFMYAHSLDYSFNHWLIQFVGALGSILLLLTLTSFYTSFSGIKKQYKTIYYITILIAAINLIGSIPIVAQFLVDNRFVLIAWLHFLFLGLYLPFIWVFIEKKINFLVWILYLVFFVFSELLLIFPEVLHNIFNISVMNLLLFAYLGIFLSILIMHTTFIIKISHAK